MLTAVQRRDWTESGHFREVPSPGKYGSGDGREQIVHNFPEPENQWL
jgi:hypothetical protein